MADVGGDVTERLLADAGVAAGMQVLDIGCGRGDVSLMLARRIGGAGRVLGIDHDAAAVAAANQRARELGVPNLHFTQADLGALGPEFGPFDAIVGRRVLMYLPEPLLALRQLAAVLRPGGLVVFQEHDATMVPGRLTPLPLHEQAHRWVWQTVEREGADIHVGFKLATLFTQAGLVVECVRAEAIVQTPTGQQHSTEAIVRAMLPRIVQHGVASATEIDVDTLGARLAAERAQANATYVGDMIFGAWAHKPGEP